MLAPTDSWPEVNDWRKRTRAELLDQRRRLSRRDKSRIGAEVIARLEHFRPRLAGRSVAFYWPMKGEIDLVGLLRDLAPEIGAAALPVVVERRRPLEFWRWTPRTKLVNRGPWNIPSPAERDLVEPDVFLVPLIGFDAAGYRLGYGGGYYDRTLATRAERAFVIGIGHELGRLPSIHPQPHDIPMHAIVTELDVAEMAKPCRAYA